MIEIPEVLASKAYRFFGEDGRRWLERLPRLRAACVEKWHLRDCRVSRTISMNYLCFAESPAYGQVALKIGVPNPELYTEIRALELFGGRNICRCHEHDLELGAMLLERIVPGHDLTSVRERSERTAIAARLIADLPVPCADEPSLPAFGDWNRRAFARVRREGKAGKRLLSFVDWAENLFSDLEREERPPHLLHGDLNHWNMLFDAGSCSWKAIDPKGAIGSSCIEAGRFIINELEFLGAAAAHRHVEDMASVIGDTLGEPRYVIALCGFLDKVLSTCWTLEEYVQKDLAVDVNHCQVLLDAYQALREDRKA